MWRITSYYRQIWHPPHPVRYTLEPVDQRLVFQLYRNWVWKILSEQIILFYLSRRSCHPLIVVSETHRWRLDFALNTVYIRISSTLKVDNRLRHADGARTHVITWPIKMCVSEAGGRATSLIRPTSEPHRTHMKPTSNPPALSVQCFNKGNFCCCFSLLRSTNT